jgi:tetraacyldisaccharide 4'-kinase
VPADLRALLGRRLEAGTRSPLALAAASLWARVAAASVARPLHLPEGAHVIGLGGAVLGGAGKTPLAVALCRELATAGHRVALVGHAYRAHPGRARVVQPDDAVTEVGDDALACARLLAGGDVVVVVGRRRQEAIDLAASLGRCVLVVDGLLQTSPRRLQAAVLVVDGRAPWGGGACPPAGDLRAAPADLLAAADHLAALLPDGATLPDELAARGAVAVPSRIDGASDAAGDRLTLADLGAARVGVLLTVARPGRILSALAAAGIHPEAVVALGDHAVPGAAVLARAGRAGVDLWLTTARCATKLPTRVGGVPVLTLGHRLSAGRLAALVGPRTGTDG